MIERLEQVDNYCLEPIVRNAITPSSVRSPRLLSSLRVQRAFLSIRVAELTNDYLYRRQKAAHAWRVARSARGLAIIAGFSSEEARHIEWAALTHDIGQSIDPGASFDHPSIGAVECARRKLPLANIIVAQQHHERWNGKGYPQGLRGSEIHPYAALVRYADVFDSALHHRNPNSPQEIAITIGNAIGTSFSPDFAEAFEEFIT